MIHSFSKQRRTPWALALLAVCSGHVMAQTPPEVQQALAQPFVWVNEQAQPTALAEFSIDPDSKAQGGLVGWVGIQQLVPEVAQAIRQMAAQQLWSEPVRTALGWHVLNLQATRPVTPPPLDKIRPQLLELLAQKTLALKLEKLRQKASIK
jgi:peptidyl-prolyl cis-trans isomerase C